MRALSSTVGATLAVVVALAPAAAQDRGSRQTREFVMTAAQTDQYEMLAATSALASTQDPNVRAFASKMIQDHQQTTQALAAATERAGVMPPPQGVSNDQAELLAALQSARGHDFDQVYAKQQALVHHAALAVEQQYASSGDTPAVKQAAAQAVPMIQMHLQMAEQLKSQLGGS
jgi:putative membrane protein